MEVLKQRKYDMSASNDITWLRRTQGVSNVLSQISPQLVAFQFISARVTQNMEQSYCPIIPAFIESCE